MRAPCPSCGKPVAADDDVPLGPHFPFCSDRCRLIDLGKWFDEEYRVARKSPAEAPDGERDPEDGGTGPRSEE